MIQNATSNPTHLPLAGSPHVELNFLLADLSTEVLSGFSLKYEDSAQLRALQDQYRGSFIFRRAGLEILAVPLLPNLAPPNSAPRSFSIDTDWSVYERVLENGIRQLLRTKYPSMNVPPFGRILFSVQGEAHDLVGEALSKQRDMLAKLGFIHIYRKYYLFGAYLKDREQGTMHLGVVIDIGTDWQLSANIETLVSKGIDPTGCYVVSLDTRQDEDGIGNKSAGCISRVDGHDVCLVDYRDQEVIDARYYTIEATLENVTRCVTSLLGRDAETALLLIRGQVGKLMNADGQRERIRTIARILSQAPIQCAHGLVANVSSDLMQAGQAGIVPFKLLEQPKYVLRYGKQIDTKSVATAVGAQGPFDQDSFKKTTPHILVLTPKRYQGRVEQFLRTWRDGGLQSPYAKGFVGQYRLRGCEFHIVDFDDTTLGSIGENYHQACLRALVESHNMVRRYDLAFVVTKESHRLLGSGDPYLIAKAALMNEDIPVQAIEIETIESPASNQRFILNNLALACYAKLGGTPWLLASSKGQGISHELVIGLGSASLSKGRYQQKDRYIGITTLFNYDGVYLLSNVSREAAYSDYPKALQDVLLSSVQHVSIQKGWQPGDRVRLIFHTFKPLKNVEIEAVKRLVGEGLPNYNVDFSFVVIGHHHDWKIYDPNSGGHRNYAGKVLGIHAPERGTVVILNDYQALLSVTGPSQLTAWYQGCPSPLQIRLNGASTFPDLEYLTRQIFEFTHMSWKTYNLPPMPITITYSEAIANLLGRLRHIKNWNSDILQTSQLGSTPWFL